MQLVSPAAVLITAGRFDNCHRLKYIVCDAVINAMFAMRVGINAKDQADGFFRTLIV